MKLHLGCGGQYCPGAINVDQYDLRVADLGADACRLPVGTETCDAVVADHLLEHLGYVGATYALAEMFRVLRPGGWLELETPDPAPSFEAFLSDESPTHRAAVLTWIFGEEQAGQGHRLLFPAELLQTMVTAAGFERQADEPPRTHRHRWGQRLVARRGHDPVARLVAGLRPTVSGLVDGMPPQEALELEHTLWDGLRRGCQEPGSTLERLLEIAIVAPDMAIALARQVEAKELEPLAGVSLRRLSRVAEALCEAGHVHVLRQGFTVLCAGVNEVADGHEHLLRASGAVARAWLDRPPVDPPRDFVRRLEAEGVALGLKAQSMPGDLDVSAGRMAVDGRQVAWPAHELFTREHLAARARWFRDVGIRCFGLGHHDEARQLLRLALCSRIEGLYSAWNMARLQSAVGQPDNAQGYYQGALSFPMPETLKARIRAEQQRCAAGEPAIEPVPVGTGVDRR